MDSETTPGIFPHDALEDMQPVRAAEGFLRSLEQLQVLEGDLCALLEYHDTLLGCPVSSDADGDDDPSGATNESPSELELAPVLREARSSTVDASGAESKGEPASEARQGTPSQSPELAERIAEQPLNATVHCQPRWTTMGIPDVLLGPQGPLPASGDTNTAGVHITTRATRSQASSGTAEAYSTGGTGSELPVGDDSHAAQEAGAQSSTVTGLGAQARLPTGEPEMVEGLHSSTY